MSNLLNPCRVKIVSLAESDVTRHTAALMRLDNGFESGMAPSGVDSLVRMGTAALSMMDSVLCAGEGVE